MECIRKQKTQGVTTIVRPLRLHCDHTFTFIQENIDWGRLQDLSPPYLNCGGNVRDALMRQFRGWALDLEEPVDVHSWHGGCCVASRNGRVTDQERDTHTDEALVVSAQSPIRFRGILSAPLRGERTVAARPIRHSSTSVTTPASFGSIRPDRRDHIVGWGRTSDGLVNLYRGPGGPPVWKEGGELVLFRNFGRGHQENSRSLMWPYEDCEPGGRPVRKIRQRL